MLLNNSEKYFLSRILSFVDSENTFFLASWFLLLFAFWSGKKAFILQLDLFYLISVSQFELLKHGVWEFDKYVCLFSSYANAHARTHPPAHAHTHTHTNKQNNWITTSEEETQQRRRDTI